MEDDISISYWRTKTGYHIIKPKAINKKARKDISEKQ